MNRHWILFCFLGLLTLSVAGSNVSSELKSVRVFMWGAEISRSATARIDAGVSELVFTSLPVDIDPNSIQVNAVGAFTILSVGHRTNFLESPRLSAQLKTLTDSIDILKVNIELQQALLKVYEEEESLLLANKSIGGSDTGVKVVDLRAIADFFRSRLTEVKNLQLETKRKLEVLQKLQNRMRQQIAQLSRERNHVGEVVVSVSAPVATRGQFELTYLTRKARWAALYDIRATDTAKPVELLMKASVSQDTGEDWNNIQLTLSTANPLDSRVVPSLDTWFLYYIEPVVMRQLKSRGMAPPASESNELFMIADAEAEVWYDETEMSYAGSAADYTTASQTSTTREYLIGTPTNIVSGANSKIVEVQRNELPASFTWYAVPRIDTDAYLLARITGWEEYVVLPGETGIFFENAYVGKTMIDPTQTKDTLEISMGTDRSVVVERKRLTDFSRKSILGRRTTETVGWELNLRNNKNRSISLEIRDQIPVTTQEDIQVTLEERTGAEYNATTGMLIWRSELAPNEASKKIFRYSVRYPSDKKIILE